MGHPHWLFYTAQAVHVAAVGISAGIQVKFTYQAGLIHAQQFGIGPDIAASKGMPWQLVESARLKVAQGAGREVEFQGDFSQRPAIVFTGLTQGLTGIDTSRC